MAQLHKNPVSQKAVDLVVAIETFPASEEATHLCCLADDLKEKINKHEQSLRGLTGRQWVDDQGTIHGE